MAKLSVVVPSNEVEVRGASGEAVKYRKVERKAQAGDIVKALTDRNTDVDKGAFYEVIDADGETGFCDNVGDLRCAGLRYHPQRFEVYEKVTRPAAVEYREVKREAEVGERIRIVDKYPTEDKYENGAEFVVCNTDGDGDVRVRIPGNSRKLVLLSEYAVIEPVNVAEPAPQPERLKVGEYARVIGSSHRSFFGGKDGDVVNIVRESDSRYKCERIDGHDYGGNPWADPESLVRATESEVEAAKKAAERAKAIGEFADGGYAVVVDVSKSHCLAGFKDGDYVTVELYEPDHRIYPLKVVGNNSGYCNADALRKVTREEYEEATKSKPVFSVGDYAKVIADNYEHRVGHIVQITKITDGPFDSFDYAVKRLTYGGNGYIHAKNIEKVSAEEVARIEEEAKWAAIGRKVGEIRKGDIVEVVNSRGGHAPVGHIGETVSAMDHNGDIRVATVDRPSGSACWSKVKLIVPVEQRFDRAEGGVSTSK
ncbi:hypothetical protein JNUCC32_31330 (plasmid) [Paenibacillus sp. JNUCC32]|uniref:hypothetical protein n=1 Tax=Paenibacillus sp. JNUCC32 TaxID=2777984 RepID=UPI001787F6C6|nr:hypothetical protein [Paenibacillus sp. JNUCC-32]QOT13693.1 hypothetical protein JNUCC32_31330 [Paenibacillus sp. JNUCC-32]